MTDAPDDQLSNRLSALTPEQRALFEMLRKKKAAPRIDLKPPPIHRRQPAEHWPLSFDQERLWFLYALNPQDVAYNIDTVTRLAGPLEAGALRLAFLEIVRRHEIWRTRFPTVDGWPVQVVEEETGLDLAFVDLLGLPEERRVPEAHRMLVEHVRYPFVLEKGPLVRASLVRLGEEEHYFVLTVHHIVTDWVTFQIFWGELIALYEPFTQGRPSPLPELPVQYADFAVWQREWMQGDVLETYRRYWLEKLAGAPLALDLPTDRPRPAVQSREGDRLWMFFDGEKAAALKALSRREGNTLFMTLLAVYQAVLLRHTGQETVLAGTVNANRNRPEIEPLLGFFLTQLVFATDLSGDLTLREVLHRVRETALGAYAHQEMPFGKLVEALQPERDLSRHPIVQVILLVLDGHFGKFQSPGLDISAVDIHDETGRYEHMVGVWDAPDNIYGWWEFQSELFDRSTIARMLDSFYRITDALLEGDLDRRLSDVPVMSPGTLHQVLVDWNEGGQIQVPETTLHALVLSRATQAPHEIALVQDGEVVTRGELVARSSRIASHLRRLEVGPEVRVGVCLPRTPDLVAAVLGILQAGGAYVPLDPAHPRERQEYLLEDSGAGVLLTAAGVAPDLVPRDGIRLELEDLATEAGEPKGDESGPGSLAYLIYTSGSTGLPKGVAVEHRSAVALLEWARGVFSEEERAGVLASTSLSFDLSLFELFLPLAWGGTVVLVDNALELLRRPAFPGGVKVTLLNTVPSVATELARTGGIPKSVRTVCLAGEPLRRSLVEQVYASSRAERVYNLYGPSEDTTYSTFTAVARGQGSEPTIGRPVAGTRAYLLNPNGDLVPIGTPGELCLGGAGLARGYLGRPDLAAARFVPDPFGTEPGGRLYRTGDLARHQVDGELEFLGRIDHQVKVRGFRVEPGEIEAALLSHPAVREAAVLAREDRPGDRRLVAYVAVEGLQGEASTILRGFLRSRLPEPLVPSAFVALGRLPLTPNGKVDRKALARLSAPDGFRGHGVPPRTPDEELLAGIWSELLGVERVGVHDDFFALGGHSLLATRLLTRVRDAFGVELPIRLAFQASTVAAQAEKIAEAQHDGGPALRGPIPRVSRDGGLPLAFAQERLWFLDRLMPGTAAYNLPLALTIEGEMPDPTLAEAAFAKIVERHEALRTVFVAEHGRPFQRILPPGAWSLPLVDLMALPTEARRSEAVRLAAADALAPFDLARGPLMRTTLLRLDPREHVLLLSIHHIVSDAWSMGVLVSEFATLYGSLLPLPELPVQYADYAVWQRGWLNGDELARQAKFWRGQLAGAPTALNLPTDRPRPAVQSFRGGLATLEVPAELSRATVDLAQREGATLFMVLLAAWGTLLSRLSDQEDLLIGTAIANRDRPELERLIGFFVNTLAMRVDLRGQGSAPAFGELLDGVRRMALDAYAHRDLPFEKLVEELQPRRDRSRQPLFQVMLVLQNTPATASDLPGLRIAPLPVGGQTAKFDLTATFVEEEGRLVGQVEYAADLFDATTVERWNVAFLRLLEGAVTNPAQPISELQFLSGEASRQLLAGAPEHTLLELAEREPRLTAYVAPRTPLEERLVSACSEVLGVERVGLQDSFFDLGGHSLLATQLLALLQERWGIELTLQDIFDSANVAGLAERITERELQTMDGEALAELMSDFQGLSPEEVQALLQEEQRTGGSE